jgi:esterase/lipase superfamily enzyme
MTADVNHDRWISVAELQDYVNREVMALTGNEQTPNVTFEEAAYRTAQITYDLGFDSAPIFYSWPSAGDVEKYVLDLDAALYARPHLQSFLELLRADSGADVIHLIAHSMGTRLLMEVLTDRRQGHPDRAEPMFHEIILAAPDIRRQDFIRMASEIEGVARGMTLYASGNDLALLGSKVIAFGSRAGDVPAEGPVVHEAVETIDATALGTRYFGLNHGEYADLPVLLRDIGLVMKESLHPPDERSFGLKKIELEAGPHWQYPRQSSFLSIR